MNNLNKNIEELIKEIENSNNNNAICNKVYSVIMISFTSKKIFLI